MSGHLVWSNAFATTWTVDAGTSALLRIEHDEGWWLVSDFLGLRYGRGDTVEAALADWVEGVREFVEWSKGQRLGVSLGREVAAYRKFLETNVVAGGSSPMEEESA